MLYRWAIRFATVAALLLGFLTAGRLGSVATAAPARQTVEVEADDNYFEPKALTVKAGTKVVWGNEGQRPHTITADNGAFNSGNLGTGASFSFTFAQAGTYPYYCEYHGGPGGQGMAGTITVTAAEAAAPAQPAAQPVAQAPAQPAAQPAAQAPAQPAAQPAVQAPAQPTLPATGTSGSGSMFIVTLALIVATLGLALRLRGERSAG